MKHLATTTSAFAAGLIATAVITNSISIPPFASGWAYL